MKRARDFLKKVIAIIRRPEMRILPGQLAFFFVLSLIPLVALVGTIGSKFGLSIDSIEGIGTVVKILLPKRLKNPEERNHV